MSLGIRQCLCIGNDDYSGNNSLPSCVNDAKDMSNSLGSIGFEVSVEKDLDYNSMKYVIERFIRSIKIDSIVLFYFSGHGIQCDGYNLLIPIDNDDINPSNIKQLSISAERLIYDIHLKKPRVVIVILDCCRTYWGPGSLLETKSLDRNSKGIKLGLVPMYPPSSTIVAYSCAAEKASSAKSKNNRNSAYTYHLLRYIRTPNVDIDHILKCVAIDVQKDSNNTQIPFRYSSCNETICLVTTQPINNQFWLSSPQSFSPFCKFSFFFFVFLFKIIPI